MRLTCPNCDAQYEVPDEVVPTSGRDVQCSNCGQTWFQHHPDHTPEDEPEDLEDMEGLEGLVSDPDAPDPDEEVAPPPPPTPPRAAEPGRRELDPAVADILRQEAEAEHAARKRRQQADQDPLESQPDLGLQQGQSADRSTADAADYDDPAETDETRTAQARNRMARLRGEPVLDATMGATGQTSRREMLPDIEEINSTLRSDDQNESGAAPDAEDAHTGTAKRSGFRTGFLLIVLVFVAMVLLYVFATQLSAAVPQLEPILSSYVVWVDGLRSWLDQRVQSMAIWLDDKAAQSSN